MWCTGVAKTVDLLLVEGHCRLLLWIRTVQDGWLNSGEQWASQACVKWLALCLQIPGRAQTRSCLVILHPSAPGSVHSLQDRPGKPQHYFCIMILQPYSCLLWLGTSSWCISLGLLWFRLYSTLITNCDCLDYCVPGKVLLWTQRCCISVLTGETNQHFYYFGVCYFASIWYSCPVTVVSR